MALALFGLALLTRLPFATPNLYAPDSVLYARGMELFDPFDQRPQPPGYLWYVLVLRAIDLVTHDPNRAMTIVSALAGAATIVLVYLLAARLYDERTARVSAVFVLTAVTFWAYGGVAYPYTLLAALTTICALVFWRALDPAQTPSGRGMRLLVASIVWGVAIGFRSDLAIFLAPLWLFAARRATLPTAGASAAAVAALVGEYGYVFSMLPGLAILAARGAIALAKGVRMPRTFRWIVAAAVLGNAAIFLFSDTPISARDIARHDRGIDEKLAYLATLAPESTEVVAAYDGVL